MILQNKRVFIVEDDPRNKTITQMLLEREGAIVQFDRWGVETVALLKAFIPVDIVLLDLMLPRSVTGFDVFKNIQADEQLAEIPVVAVSASDTSVAVPRAQEMGFSGFIAKPIDFHRFAGQISTILDGTPIWESSGASFII